MNKLWFHLLFPQYANQLDSSVARIRDLERTIEIMTGANSVLSQQLEKAQLNEERLKEKIFEITGVSHSPKTPVQTSTASLKPINIDRRVEWAKLKDDLETKTRMEYWEEKKRKAEELDKLEKEILASERTK